ncbi:MAG: hypothetical protein NXY57DRAFT_1043083 [Lentinula lateritia]|nr:MAG: hypothetical protein NXY57DRAFT_1043083 [Lentinula lateritia]
MSSTSVEHEDHNSASFKAEYCAYMRQAWSDDLTERRQAKFLDYFFAECNSKGLRGYAKMRLHSIFMLFIKEHMQKTQPDFEKLVRAKCINEGFAGDEKVWVQFKTESFPKEQPQPIIPFEYIMRPPPRVNWVPARLRSITAHTAEIITHKAPLSPSKAKPQARPQILLNSPKANTQSIRGKKQNELLLKDVLVSNAIRIKRGLSVASMLRKETANHFFATQCYQQARGDNSGSNFNDTPTVWRNLTNLFLGIRFLLHFLLRFLLRFLFHFLLRFLLRFLFHFLLRFLVFDLVFDLPLDLNILRRLRFNLFFILLLLFYSSRTSQEVVEVVVEFEDVVEVKEVKFKDVVEVKFEEVEVKFEEVKVEVKEEEVVQEEEVGREKHEPNEGCSEYREDTRDTRDRGREERDNEKEGRGKDKENEESGGDKEKEKEGWDKEKEKEKEEEKGE